jgi:hypothetical protein
MESAVATVFVVNGFGGRGAHRLGLEFLQPRQIVLRECRFVRRGCVERKQIFGLAVIGDDDRAFGLDNLLNLWEGTAQFANCCRPSLLLSIRVQA